MPTTIVGRAWGIGPKYWRNHLPANSGLICTTGKHGARSHRHIAVPGACRGPTSSIEGGHRGPPSIYQAPSGPVVQLKCTRNCPQPRRNNGARTALDFSVSCNAILTPINRACANYPGRTPNSRFANVPRGAPISRPILQAQSNHPKRSIRRSRRGAAIEVPSNGGKKPECATPFYFPATAFTPSDNALKIFV